MLNKQDKQEITKFISMLYHDDHDSNYFVCNLDDRMHSLRTSLSEFDMSQVKENDCYISLNGFAGHHRKIKECRQINGIVFDLDYHHNVTEAEMEWIKKRSLQYILDAFSSGDLYEANIITDTTRGLQLIYIFENSISYRCKNSEINSKTLYAYEKIRDNIEAKIKAALPEENSLEYDSNVHDISRIIRLPGTVNTKTGKKAHILHINEDYYVFTDFYTKKKNADKKEITPKQFKKFKRLNNKTALNEARINEIEKLQQIRKDNCEGHRDYMTFIYYNSAVQIYGHKEATEKTYAFCQNFGRCDSSFGDAQIRAIIKEIDTNVTKDFKGYYIITKEWIIEKLNITDEEADLIGMSKSLNARELRKRNNAKAKNERNAKIIKMADENIRHSDIAKEVGVSLRTVQNVLKNSGMVREYSTNVNVQNNAS